MEFITIGPVHIRGWGGAQGWGEWSMVEVRVAMTSTAPTKGQYSTTRHRQTCADSGSDIRATLPNRNLPLVPFHQLWIYMVRKKHSGEAVQLTLANGGSEHA